ncbi:MAG: hypothetical protein AAB797_01605 [Patescibacteria group bacterium]
MIIWNALSALVVLGVFLFGLLCAVITVGYCIRSWIKIRKKIPELNSKQEIFIEPPKEISLIIEENKKRWLEKQAEAEAWLNEGDCRPYAKVLRFPRKL